MNQRGRYTTGLCVGTIPAVPLSLRKGSAFPSLVSKSWRLRLRGVAAPLKSGHRKAKGFPQGRWHSHVRATRYRVVVLTL
jgi:hypothetical protein